ncbi:MAG TPA: GNAT family N-acetyltransferase [Chitinophagaceae bacterium]|nr:GNAT family N-acetyltransferase [Chitinophagaceae bacterium]
MEQNIEYSLRPATAADSDFFYTVKKTVLQKYIEEIWGWNEDFQLQYHADNYNTAITNIIIKGNIAMGTVEIREDEAEIFISGLYLLPPYQGWGIGTGIINECIEKASANNKRVSLEVLKINAGAQKLYSRLGFTLQERDDVKYFMYKDYMHEQDKAGF